MKQVIVLALSLLLLSACGSKVEGTYSYTDEMGGILEYKFAPGGKLYWSVKEREGQKVVKAGEYKYEVNGDKVKIIRPEVSAVFYTLREDGSLANDKYLSKEAGTVIFRKKK